MGGLLCALVAPYAPAQRGEIAGTVQDAAGRPIAHASVELRAVAGRAVARVETNDLGRFAVPVAAGLVFQLEVRAPAFATVRQRVDLRAGGAGRPVQVRLLPGVAESVTVTGSIDAVDLLAPDPAEKVFVKEELLDANPGRPGAPMSIPGYPAETASGGIKAPQYFAPGVAGDHGEPIAQYIAVGGYLLPNNLSANAHGNGYADPNLLISSALADVAVNGGAYNVLEGNHAVNVAVVYRMRARLDPSLTLTLDPRDVDVSTAVRPGPASWVAAEGSWGNGFLRRLEHRQQYKLNTQTVVNAGEHRLTLFGVAYYGSSFIPGLVPVFAANVDDVQYSDLGDTVDPRQREQTHTALVAANDVWSPDARQQVQASGFFRTYNLSLFSDFGQGLIRQSEFRTVAGASALYTNRVSEPFAVLAGVDVQREAPRRDNLDHYDVYTPGNNALGPFAKVDGSNVTITPVTPYVAVQGALGGHVRYYAGWRRDEIDFTNQDLVLPANSFHEWAGVNSPKATVSVLPGPARWAPTISGSFGEAFFTEDPRIGTGTARGTEVSRAHAYQLVVDRTVGKTDVRLTLGHVTTSEELAKIDPDTGLQEDQGPGRMRFLTATVRQSFSRGFVLLTFSKADARDVVPGQPTAEAPRTIVDALGGLQRLPWQLQAKAEFEYVGAKPLGTGCAPDLQAQCIGVPVREVRLAAARPFVGDRLLVSLNALLANGYTGQTLETFASSAVAEVTGVRLRPYASVSVSYRFGERGRP